MVIPGVSRKFVSKLRKEDSDAVLKHLKAVREIIIRKRNLMDGKLEELGETIKNPRDEVEQLTVIIGEIEKYVGADILTLLIAFEVDARRLVESIDEEYNLLKKLEKGAHGNVKKEVEGEILLGKIMEHQLNIIYNVQKIGKEIVNKASKLSNKKHRDRICRNIQNMSNISSHFSNIILREETPQLALAYNMLKLKEWPNLQKRIDEIITRFAEIEPHLL